MGEGPKAGVNDGSLTSLGKLGPRGQAVCKPVGFVPAWIQDRRSRRGRSVRSRSDLEEAQSTWLGCQQQGHGPADLSSPSPPCLALGCSQGKSSLPPWVLAVLTKHFKAEMLSAEEMTYGLARVAFAFCFAFCCQFSSDYFHTYQFFQELTAVFFLFSSDLG